MVERKFFVETRMVRCNLLARAARSLHVIKGLSSKSQGSPNPLLQLQELCFWFKKKKKRGQILLPPCPAFAGNCLVLQPKMSFHAGQLHPQRWPSVCSYPSPGRSTAALSQWSALCPPSLSFRPYPNKVNPAFGVKAQLMELPPALRTGHLLQRRQQPEMPSPCAANGLWLCRVKERTSPLGKPGIFGLNAFQPRRIINDKEDDGHGATFERNRREGAWLLQQQGWAFRKISFSFHLPIFPPRQHSAAAGDKRWHLHSH